jgi:hypothetical protein
MTKREYDERLRYLRQAGTEIFTVVFRRRTDSRDGTAKAGDLRTMQCRFGVSKGVIGAEPDRTQKDHDLGLATVFEMAGPRSGFRRVPLDAVVEVR